MRNNVVHAASQHGISTTDGSENEISGNRVTGGDAGIAVFADSASAIHHNLVFGNNEAGIQLFIAEGTSIRNNTVRLPGAVGVVVFVVANVQVVSTTSGTAAWPGWRSWSVSPAR